ncbi:hypothetical protein CVT24_008877 [Panaeolus cyanescens]|uniref:non-specific serine/threonine protein kinase n=1 Tax=Panaeolus cyanescens TaxID=181874 RepID=A0A409VAW4_9AGAR|nr:hypothetical protein CVT24_008877 [Panaeolus cyanescens]
MDSEEDPQLLEITALQSIYANDFIPVPPPKAWKGAARLHEFIIRVAHPDTTHESKVYLNLRVKFPKTYPRLACPTFAIEKPIKGINDGQVAKLSHEINVEAQKLRGFEMVFSIVTFCQDWITKNITPPVEAIGSLALQMSQRARDEEKERLRRELEEAEKEEERVSQAARELDAQIQADSMRNLWAKEEQIRTRKRANSEATEVPSVEDFAFSDTIIETFADAEINGKMFNSVKLYYPRAVPLGLVYMAEPILEDLSGITPLEVFMVTFSSPYYFTISGRKKLQKLEEDIQKLVSIRHPKLLTVYGVKLHVPPSSSGKPAMLMVLSEQKPALTLHDVLLECESLREERALDYTRQLLTALSALHISGLHHKGINPRCIGLVQQDNPSQPKTVKLSNATYHATLRDLHRSNSFGDMTPPIPEEPVVAQAWLSRDALTESSLFYSNQRDIHSVGVVMLQMMIGLDVMERYPDAGAAIQQSDISPALARQIMNMIHSPRKNGVSCATLLAELADSSTSHSPMSSRIGIPISGSDPRTPTPFPAVGSPDADYFKTKSRWKEEWEELELLGRGAFGSVVKARMTLDGRIYAVKKVRLRTMQKDAKIFREVRALSRLSHRNIVRYYTTWIETSEAQSAVPSDDESGFDSESEEGMTSVPPSNGSPIRNQPINGAFYVDMDVFDKSRSRSRSRSSFPSIHFGPASSPGTSGEEDSSSSSSEGGGLFRSASSSGSGPKRLNLTMPPASRTLYIQMEFVERQTLRERIEEGLSEDESWKLFLQLVDALAHMATLGVLHRDIKLANIFIDAKGDCKIGDFGLATSSLAAVDPSDVSPQAVIQEADMTLEVGTRLYIAPEVQSKKHKSHAKADMYSLGIVFFEMNYFFSTGSERIAVLEDLRRPSIIFPLSWDTHRTRQRDIITWLLQHEPDKRPTALELSQSPLLPSRVEDEHFKNTLRMIKPDTPLHQLVLSTVFKQPIRPSRAFIYDIETESPEYATLNGPVQERLTAIFHLHGAVDTEPPLLMPITDQDEKNSVTLVDRHGEVVALPNDILVPFARLAARENIRRIKRFHIMNVFMPNSVPGHPKYLKAAFFDIITPDVELGPIAAGAEMISIVNDILDNFPNLSQHYDIHISHSKVTELALNRVPAEIRDAVLDIIDQAKSTVSQKRQLLIKKGLLRSTVEELEILSDIAGVDDIVNRLERVSPTLVTLLQPAIKEVKKTIELFHFTFGQSNRSPRPVYFHPLMLGVHHEHHKDGVLIEVVRRNKSWDLLAAGGRYDKLISKFSQHKAGAGPSCAFGIQIVMEKITQALAVYQKASLKNLVKEGQSFGFWSPRRCDVYVVSYTPGQLRERLNITAHLWRNNISADLMYETGLPASEHEHHLESCAREGILFTVLPRPRPGRISAAFKVKSVLKGTEVELSFQELVPWLQHAITEQKRLDAQTSGAPVITEHMPVPSGSGKDGFAAPDVHVVLPDPKKQRKQTKQIVFDKAFDKSRAIKNSFQTGMPVLAVDVSPGLFEAMIKNPAWVTEEDAWKSIASLFPAGYSGYAQSVRDAANKRKSEGHNYILLFAVREDRAQLLQLTN